MWTALDVFVGLTLCYALASLFCSAIQEFIAQALDSRGKLLVEALKEAKLGSLTDAVTNAVVTNPGSLLSEVQMSSRSVVAKVGSLIDKANPKAGGNGLAENNRNNQIMPSAGEQKPIVGRLPHDIPASTLASALLNRAALLQNGSVVGPFDHAVNNAEIPEALKMRLLSLSTGARTDVDTVKQEVEGWFVEFMDQVQHWYVRRAQIRSLVLGLMVALFLNVDTIEIAKTLLRDSTVRASVVALATKYASEGKVENCPVPSSEAKQDGKTTLVAQQDRVTACFNSIAANYPFAIGWQFTPEVSSTNWWKKPFIVAGDVLEQLFNGTKLLGILLSGLALSLGARFWFDTLKNLMAIRTGGQPEKKPA